MSWAKDHTVEVYPATSRRLVDLQKVVELRKTADPFIKWLQEAEEEEA